MGFIPKNGMRWSDKGRTRGQSDDGLHFDTSHARVQLPLLDRCSVFLSANHWHHTRAACHLKPLALTLQNRGESAYMSRLALRVLKSRHITFTTILHRPPFFRESQHQLHDATQKFSHKLLSIRDRIPFSRHPNHISKTTHPNNQRRPARIGGKSHIIKREDLIHASLICI